MDKELILQYLKAMVSLYGIIPVQKALEIINNQNSDTITATDLAAIDLDDTIVEREGELFVHEALYADDSVEELLAKQGDKPFCVPEKTELLKYSDGQYFERIQAYDDLKDFLIREFTVRDQTAEDICEDIQGMAAIGSFSVKTAMNDVQRRKISFSGVEQINRLMKYITELVNNTRNWDNRGYTPHELFEKYDKPNLRLLPAVLLDFGGKNRDRNVAGKDTGLGDPVSWTQDSGGRTRDSDEWAHDLSEEEALLLEYVRALINLYGVVEKAKVIEIFNAQNAQDGQSMTIGDLEAVLEEVDPDHEIFDIEGDLLVEESLLMDDEDLPRLLTRQKGKPYYIPEKEELLYYCDDLYRERPPSFMRLQQFIQQTFKLDSGDAEELCEDIHLGFLNADFSVDYVLFEIERRRMSFANDAQVREFVRLALDLANHSRCWANLGFTPAEMLAMNERSRSASQSQSHKVGRNDLCPCGSGKKYKNCCGGN